MVADHEFINVKFKEGELEHGHRYIVCIHTQYTEIHFEKWTQVLPEINTCSDGIRVDLTPPSPGNIWIGKPGQRYQVNQTEYYLLCVSLYLDCFNPKLKSWSSEQFISIFTP